MKEPMTQRKRQGGRRTTARARRPKVPGGKALARILFFERQRELPEVDVLKPKPDKPLLRKLKLSAREASMSTVGIKGEEHSPYRQAHLQMAARHVASTAAAPTAAAVQVTPGWRPLGPFSIPHGQTYGSGTGSRPAVSGRVSSVAVDPSNDQHILIGAAGGGVWETRDSGRTWQPRTDDQATLSIGAIAFDPTNSSVAYAGTGEGDSGGQLGAGLLRSTDGGTTWNLHATEPFEGTGFYDLAVDPLDGDHLLAGTTAGLFESTDGGVTWTSRRAARTWNVSFHPVVAGDDDSTQEVFAGTSDGVLRSTNGGTNWSVVSLSGLPSNIERIEVRHAPSNGNIGYVFAAGNTAKLWRRNTAGGAFSPFNPPSDLDVGQAWYDWFAAVAPNNPDVLYLGAIDVHKGVRQPNGSWAWQTISAKNSGDCIHPDQHAIDFSPTDPNVVYVGNDGGLYRSDDGGISWESLNEGLNITEFEFIVQHPEFEAFLLGGTQDNGTLRYQGKQLWFHVQDGDGGDCGVNAASPYTCFHTFYGMGMERSTRGGTWETWNWVGPNVPDNKNYPGGALFYPPLEVNGQVVAQAGKSVYISRNSGTNWTEVPLPGNAGLASALAIPSTTQVYVGTSNGRIYRIQFAQNAWGSPSSLGQPRPGFVSDLLLDPTNDQRIWVTYSTLNGSHVFRSTDVMKCAHFTFLHSKVCKKKASSPQGEACPLSPPAW
jgi:photosystem II stability/assembly factor-like uncharacterized protein